MFNVLYGLCWSLSEEGPATKCWGAPAAGGAGWNTSGYERAGGPWGKSSEAKNAAVVTGPESLPAARLAVALLVRFGWDWDKAGAAGGHVVGSPAGYRHKCIRGISHLECATDFRLLILQVYTGWLGGGGPAFLYC